jgi:hypothetical protein
MKKKIEMKQDGHGSSGYRIESNVIWKKKDTRELENKLNQKPPQCL